MNKERKQLEQQQIDYLVKQQASQTEQQGKKVKQLTKQVEGQNEAIKEHKIKVRQQEQKVKQGFIQNSTLITQNSCKEYITSINAERVSPIPEEVEFFIEQIESQKLYLEYLEQQLQDIQEELRYTNQELEYMNSELCSTFQSQPMPLNEAKELAKTILASQKPTRESLAQLLSAIYGSIVDPWELGLRQIPRRLISTRK